ncbi:hypothetical protein GcM3_151014 [Golovinomyces cichoracearum]|uniref:Uncharacterized protein n=1 Tax=Golovinomyces cichoracearum TaxID=62708 RepID=A0A420HX23_9PEZI|nr:hypothetical protein GcM3_151014 [Golovinomyces cichoracearum]
MPLGYNAHAYDVKAIGTIAGLRTICPHFIACGWLTQTSSSRVLEVQRLHEAWYRRDRTIGTSIGPVIVR